MDNRLVSFSRNAVNKETLLKRRSVGLHDDNDDDDDDDNFRTCYRF